ncbi:MAG TPA: hypothetical protein VF432_01685 [Thermoanaerobaculia bacterium]
MVLTLLPGAGRAETGKTAPAVRTTGITVTMYCTSDSITCEAVATGGSGGYSFAWTNAELGYTEGNYSEAAPQCWSGHNKFTVSVTVTDGLGATGTASKYFVCP